MKSLPHMMPRQHYHTHTLQWTVTPCVLMFMGLNRTMIIKIKIKKRVLTKETQLVEEDMLDVTNIHMLIFDDNVNVDYIYIYVLGDSWV